MCSAGEGSASTRTTPLSTVDVSESCADVGTTPGQSMRYILRVRVMYCQTYLEDQVITRLPRRKIKITNLGFARYGSDPTNLVAFDCVDNTAFPDIRVADEPYGYLLFI
jgi:hypothetical protein